MAHERTYQQLLDELNETRIQLEEANDVIEAIRSGEVDALVVKDKEGHQLYTLKSADQTYRIFIEQMAEGAVTVNRENLILYCNSQFAFMVGLPLEKVIGQLFSKFIDPEYLEDCTWLIERAWDGNIKGEVQLHTQRGRPMPVLLSLQTLDLDEGLSMSIILTDLTSQKETQQLLLLRNEQLETAEKVARQLNANLENTVRERTKELEINILEKIRIEDDLRENQERLTRILETMAEGVAIVDTTGNLTYANPMAQKILGLNQSDTLTRIYHESNWENLRIDGSPLPDDEHPMAIMLATGKAVYDHEISVKPPNHERFYISINAAPLHDHKGNLAGGVGTFMDVTNRRKIAQQKDEFISVASHELKTPLTSLNASMQSLTKLIGTDPSSPRVPAFTDMANKSLAKIVQLTEDLMNVSKIQHGPLSLHKTWFCVADLINDCCDHIRTSGTHELILTGDLSLRVHADFLRIDQVVVNLVNNAVKYAPDSRKISLHIGEVNGMAKVSVQDEGIGIPPENIPHLFDRYYRVEASGVQFSGLGLGLYISSEIIERHGGEMGVDSIPGKGSTFWFTLPLG